MPAIDTNDLMGNARCVDNCIPPGAQLPVLISIFAQIANMSLDPATLMAGARCVDNCVPAGMRMSVLISLAQQILDNGGGGGGGSGGNANLIPDGTDPNGTETATQGLRYDSLGNVWLKTNGVNNATGWEKIISASMAMNAEAAQAAEEEAQVNAQWPTRTSAKASLLVSGETLPASPQFVPVTLSEPRSSRMRRFLDALKTFVMSFFSFLPLILFLIVFSPSQSKAIPPPLLFNFCTTNTPTVLSNIFKSFVTNTGNALFVKKAGDTMTGDLTVNAHIEALTLTANTATFPGGILVGDQSSFPFGMNNNGDLTASEVIAINYVSTGGIFDGYVNVADVNGAQQFIASVSNTVIGAIGVTPIILNVDGTSFFNGNITNNVLTANRAVITDGSTPPALASSATTATELGHVSGVTSALQPQLDGKQAGPLTGDVTSSGAATTLKNTGTAGTYTKTTFDAQGRETSGTSATLASSDYANQGTTTTLLHGNAAGNPSWGPVVAGDILLGGNIVTQNNSFAVVVSNKWGMDAAHALSLSNATVSKVAIIGADNTLTNSGLGAVPINGDTTATTFPQVNALAPGFVWTNGLNIAGSLSNQVTIYKSAPGAAGQSNYVNFTGDMIQASNAQTKSVLLYTNGELRIYGPNGSAGTYLALGLAGGETHSISSFANALGQNYTLVGDTTGAGGPAELRFGAAGFVSWRSTTRSDTGTTVAGIGTNIANGGLEVNNGTGGTLTNLTAKKVTATTLNVTTSVSPDSGAIKHSRVTTGSIGTASTALITVTWATAFADANYTVVADVVDSTTTSLSLSVVHVETVSASAVTVRVINNSATTAITGILHCVAIHD